MKISRASFLKHCSLALLGAFAGGSPALFRWAESFDFRRRFRLQEASAALFNGHLNDRFTVRVPGQRSVRFVLAKVIELPVMKNFEQFSAIFHGPVGAKLADGTYTFEHPALGRVDLFIVAIGQPRSDRTTYQACFSRPAQAA